MADVQVMTVFGDLQVHDSTVFCTCLNTGKAAPLKPITMSAVCTAFRCVFLKYMDFFSKMPITLFRPGV